jgi:hypothetical protein
VFADLGALTHAIRPRGESDHRNLTGIRTFGPCFLNPLGFMGRETGDFPMLSGAEPVILPRDSDENR